MVVKKAAVKTVKKPAVKKAVVKRTATPRKPAKAVAKVALKGKISAAASKAKKEKKTGSKEKVLRDSFSMPKSDFEKIAVLKAQCNKQGLHVKKSELLRAGLHALSKMSAAQLKQAVAGLEVVKTGRPKKA